jgi:uncharacterized membrane protein YphA (DoxX/SURF4 family)
MNLAMSAGSMARCLVAGLILIAVSLAIITAVRPAGEDLVFAALWIVTVGLAAAGLITAIRARRPLVGLGSIMASIGALLAFYWKPMPSPIIWPILFLGGVLLIAYGSKDDSWHKGTWALVLVRIAVGWGWLDNAQDHLRGTAQTVWVPGGGQYLTVAKSALSRGAPPSTQGAQPYGWFGDAAYLGFLKDVVVPNGDLWAGLTLSGEMAFGILLAVGLLTPIAAVGSMWQSANYILMKGAFVHAAYTDKAFFLLAAFCFVTAAGLSYGLDASLRRVMPGWFAVTFLGAPGLEQEREPAGGVQPTPMPA